VFRLLAGEGYNLLPRMRKLGLTAAYVTANPALMSTGPYTFLWDGAVSPAMRFSAAATAPYVDFDCTAINNYGFEDATTSPFAGMATATDQKHTGTYALKGTASGQSAYVDINVRPDEQWKFIAWSRADGGGTRASFKLQILDSNLYWTGSAWGASTVLGANTTTTWTTYTTTLTLPSFSTLLRPMVTLRIYCNQDTAAGSVWFDDIAFIPGVNAFIALGHNAPVRAPVNFTEWDGEAYQGGSVTGHPATNFQRGVSAYLPGAMMFRRSWRFYACDDTISAIGFAPRVGEVIFGQLVDLLKNPNFPIRFTTRELGQVRNASRDGAETVYSLASRPAWTGLLSFSFPTQAAYEQLRNALIYSGRSGGFPAVIVPTETDPDLLLYGRMSEQGTAFNRLGANVRQAEFTFNEEVSPSFLVADQLTGI